MASWCECCPCVVCPTRLPPSHLPPQVLFCTLTGEQRTLYKGYLSSKELQVWMGWGAWMCGVW